MGGVSAVATPGRHDTELDLRFLRRRARRRGCLLVQLCYSSRNDEDIQGMRTDDADYRLPRVTPHVLRTTYFVVARVCVLCVCCIVFGDG